MRKSNLRSGMVVETRNGYLYLVVGDFITKENGFIILQYYNEDMLNVEGKCSYDIMKVYVFDNVVFDNHATRLKSLFDRECLTLLWERKEHNLTEREVEILKALQTLGYEWLTRDSNGRLFAFVHKPEKMNIVWEFAGGTMITRIDENLFTFIKWADFKPVSVKELLK